MFGLEFVEYIGALPPLPFAKNGKSLIVLNGIFLIKQTMWYIKNGPYIKPPFWGLIPFITNPEMNGRNNKKHKIQKKYVSLYSSLSKCTILRLFFPRPFKVTFTLGPNFAAKNIVPTYAYNIQNMAVYFIISVCGGKKLVNICQVIKSTDPITTMRKRLIDQSFLKKVNIVFTLEKFNIFLLLIVGFMPQNTSLLKYFSQKDVYQDVGFVQIYFYKHIL
jgi:hypothetical protein